MKIGVDTFRQANLAVGTVLACRPHPDLPALSVVTVQLGEEVEALAPSSALPPEPVGQRLVVATALHPLRLGGRQYRASVVSSGPSAAAIVADVPDQVVDGSRLE